MPEIDLKDRARGCLAGLAVGDALGRPVEGMSALEIREKYGSVSDFVNMTPGGSDDTEYALLTASAILKYGKKITADDFADFWIEKVCPQTQAFAGANLRSGLRPPFSGQHNHAWSDGLAMRVAPVGIISVGDYESAKRIAIADGMVSHAGEGIHSGVVIAVAIAAAMDGLDAQRVFDDACDSIPKDSWTYRSMMDVKEIVLKNRDLQKSELADLLLKKLAVVDYFYADLAPEAVSLAMAVNLGRDADTIAAMAGAVVGAIAGYTAIPDNWKKAVITVGGTCLQFAEGLNPYSLAEQLIELEG